MRVLYDACLSVASKCAKGGKGTYVEEKGDASGSIEGDRWKVGRTISLCSYIPLFLPLVERASVKVVG